MNFQESRQVYISLITRFPSVMSVVVSPDYNFV
jgi:hypothetical protein